MGCARSEPVPVKPAQNQMLAAAALMGPEGAMLPGMPGTPGMPGEQMSPGAMPAGMSPGMMAGAGKVRPGPGGRPTGATAGNPDKPTEAPFIADPSGARWNDVIRGDLRMLTSDSPSARLPVKLWPICCLADLALPIIVMPVILVTGEGTDLQMPVMGISRLKLGRILALGSFEMLMKSSRDRETDTVFIENVLRWAAGANPSGRTALIYGLQKRVATTLSDVMSGFGFTFEIQDDGKIEHQKYVFLMLGSDCREKTGLELYLEKGGCIICAPGDEDSEDCFALNSVIGAAGIAFSEGPLYFARERETFYRFDRNLKDLYSYTLPVFARSFQDMLTSKAIKEEALDTVAATLRYHAKVILGRKSLSGMRGMCSEGIRYLYDSGYVQDKLVCQDYKQAVVATLLSEAFRVMTPQDLMFDLSPTFPGKCDTINGQDVETISVKMATDEWTSTELYLRAGISATVKVRTTIRGLILMIGSHSASVSNKKPPWKRWPNVTMTYVLKKGMNEICSPFGGLIYFKAPGPVNPISPIVESMLSGCYRPPNFHYQRPGKWLKGKPVGIPFCELIGRRLIITIPTVEARRFPQVESAMKFFDEVIDLMSPLLGTGNEQSISRVVFDVELPNDEPVVGYPIFLDYSWIDIVLEKQEPSHDFFNFISLIALSLLPTGMLNGALEAAIAMAATWNIFCRRWPHIEVSTYSTIEKNEVSSVIMRGMYEGGNTALSNALKQVRKEVGTTAAANGEAFAKAFSPSLGDSLIAKVKQADGK